MTQTISDWECVYVCACACTHAHVQGCGGNGILVGRDLILLIKVILTFRDGGCAAQLKGEYLARIKVIG